MANNKNFKVKNGLSAPTIKESATIDVPIESQPYYAGKRNSAETEEEYIALSGIDSGGAQGLIVDLAPITGQNGASFFIDPDGKYLFIADTSTSDYKVQRCLFGTSTPFRLDTVSISVNRQEKALGSSELDPWGGITFSPDGTTFLSTEGTFVYERSISAATPWEITSLSSPTSHDMQSLNGLGPSSTISGVTFGKDGTRLYLVDNLTDTICQANLSTAYDVGTITTSSFIRPYVGMYDPNPESNAGTSYTSGLNQMRNVKFSEDGTQAFILDGSGSPKIWVFELSTPWEIATLRRPALKVYRPSAGYIDDVNKEIKDFFFMTGTDLVLLREDDGIFYANLNGNKVDLDLTTNSSFNITLGEIGEYQGSDPSLGRSYENIYNAGGSWMNGACKMDATAGDLKININADADLENQTAVIKIENKLKTWPIHALYYDRTTTPTGAFVGTTSPRGNRLSDDGTRLWIIDQDSATGANAIREYNLTTAWDITTLVSNPVQHQNLNIEDTAMIDFMFNDDGTKFFALGDANNRLYEYNLSTPYDLNTITYTNNNLNVGAQSTQTMGFLFKPDGTKGYYFSSSNVYEYDFSTPWDTTTGTYTGNALSGFTSSNPVRWGPNGYSIYYTHTNEAIIELILHEPYNPLSAQVDQSFNNTQSAMNRQTYVGHLIGTSTGYLTTFAITDTNEIKAYLFNPNQGSPWTMWQLEVSNPTINWPNNIYWKDGIAPEAPAYGETDIYLLNTTNGGHTYNGVVAIDGAK